VKWKRRKKKTDTERKRERGERGGRKRIGHGDSSRDLAMKIDK
jgi:hypothetical protein